MCPKILNIQDRTHAPQTTHYCFAQHHERLADFSSALKHYEAAGVAAVEVPRMYFEHGMLDKLQDYVTRSSSKELLVWWGRYCESQGNFPEAIAHYQRAGRCWAY